MESQALRTQSKLINNPDLHHVPRATRWEPESKGINEMKVKKVDLKLRYKSLYNPRKGEVSTVQVPDFHYLMLSGGGGAGKEYQHAVQALLKVAYELKTLIREAHEELEYVVMPVEGIYWTDNPDKFQFNNRNEWKWTVMIMQPDQVTHDMFEKARFKVNKAKPDAVLEKMNLSVFHEGKCAQTLHVGTYENQVDALKAIRHYVASEGGHFYGKHHEIYLNDPTKTVESRLKTIIRMPYATK